MKREQTGLRPASAAACAALLFLLLVAASPTASAQAGGPPPHRPPPPAKPDPIPNPPSVRERQLIMDEMARELGRGTPRKSEELRMSEIADDYRDIQQVNNRMMGAVMRAATPDYKLVGDAVAEIRRRAERLRENLALPAPEAKDKEARQELKQAEDAAGMKSALLALDRALMSFVKSPLFKNTDVLDAEAASKASRDLAEVIERSRLAAKDAERLAKKSKN